MNPLHRTELRDVKSRLKKAASDLAAALRTNRQALLALTKQKRAALRSFEKSEGLLHKDNRLAEREHTATTRALLKRQAVLEGRLAS